MHSAVLPVVSSPIAQQKLLFIDVDNPSMVHFILFIRAIMVLHRQKRTTAKGLPLQNVAGLA
jgi:hypothetical protein